MSSVVVGVSNEVPMLPYKVAASEGATLTPSEPESARMRRRPESSGLVAVISRSSTEKFTQS